MYEWDNKNRSSMLDELRRPQRVAEFHHAILRLTMLVCKPDNAGKRFTLVIGWSHNNDVVGWTIAVGPAPMPEEVKTAMNKQGSTDDGQPPELFVTTLCSRASAKDALSDVLTAVCDGIVDLMGKCEQSKDADVVLKQYETVAAKLKDRDSMTKLITGSSFGEEVF